MTNYSDHKQELLKDFQRHIDQASVLVQLDLLNPASLPVNGVETAKKMDVLRGRLNNYGI